MTFLHPQVLFALTLPIILGIAIAYIHKRAGSAWRQLVSDAHPELVCRTPKWRNVVPPLLALLALTCIIIACARPINGYGQSEATATGRNLLIALDVSRSMETQDVTPSRLEEARAAAYELIDALPGDKIGLIVFAGEADVVVPLTYDHTALRDALEQVNRSWAGAGGTNFGLLLRTAMQNFARSAPEGANALVILSDGEDTVESSLDVAEEARKNNLLVITVGIGTPVGAAIPDSRGENGLWQDSTGKHVISKLDVQALQRFAQSTGGDFITMGSGTDLSAFAREAANKLERHEESYAAGRAPLDLYAWFILPSLIFLLLSIILGSEWKAPRHTTLILALAFIPTYAEAAPSDDYRLGLEALSQGEHNTALEMLSAALLSDDTSLQAAAHHALGNLQTRASFDKLRALYEQGDADTPSNGATPDALQAIVDELKKDLTPYRDALSADAGLSAAQTNIDKIEQLIKVLEDEIERLRQQQNQDQQKDQDQQQNQDQQKDQDQQQNQDQQKDQDQQQNQDQQKDQDQQQNQDQQKDQDQQQNQDQQKDQDQQQNQDQQKDQDQQQNQDQQGNSSERNAQPQDIESPQSELSEDEKNKQRAAGILRMHLDEEKGSPIPHPNRAIKPPLKDY